MKVVFLSNYFNHHQADLSDALWEMTMGEYLFVETASMPPERKQLGYSSAQKAYLCRLEQDRGLVLRSIREADVVIAGSAPEWLVRERIKTGKLLFRYGERPLRNGLEPLKYIPRLLRWHWRNPAGKPIYLLCASAYTAGDYAKFGLFRDRAFRWGYFPERKDYDLRKLLSTKQLAEVLWCGRFLELKHPQDVLTAAGELKKEGYSFQLRFLGTGELEETLRRTVREQKLEGSVHFLGARTPEEVRKAMETAGIYLFTSDRREGWGAVLNEAMNSGCAVIASQEIGAVPYLVKDGQNGLVYRSGDVQMLKEKLRYLLDHPAEQRRLGAAAYAAIQKTWNGQAAAERLMQLSRSILEERELPRFEDGPCSRADRIREDWFS